MSAPIKVGDRVALREEALSGDRFRVGWVVRLDGEEFALIRWRHRRNHPTVTRERTEALAHVAWGRLWAGP